MEEIERHRNNLKPGRDTRLFKEWEKLDEACSASSEVAYIIRKVNASGLPVVYDIIFRIKSITGVESPDEQGLQKPVFGEEHILRIQLPNNYPAAGEGAPEFKFITDVWHPNVRFFGDFKGRVCLNLKDCGTAVYLTEHIGTVAAYLRYSDYHARNEYPYPEDQTVAQWTLEQAEPQGWLHFSVKILITALLLCSFLCQGKAQEISLNPGDSGNKQSVSVKLYDNNEGGFLLDLPLTFHLNRKNILFMIVGDENGTGSENSVWMFDKTIPLDDFLKQNKNVVAAKTLKKYAVHLESFYKESENVEKHTLFDRGFEWVQSSPKPVFFQIKDLSKPVKLKLKFYVSSEKSDRTQVLTSETGIIKLTINISKQ